MQKNKKRKMSALRKVAKGFASGYVSTGSKEHQKTQKKQQKNIEMARYVRSRKVLRKVP